MRSLRDSNSSDFRVIERTTSGHEEAVRPVGALLGNDGQRMNTGLDMFQGVSDLATFISSVHSTDVDLSISILLSKGSHLCLDFIESLLADRHDIELLGAINQDAFDSWQQVVILVVHHGENDCDLPQVDGLWVLSSRGRIVSRTTDVI